MTWLTDALTRNRLPQRDAQDLQVQTKAPMMNIPDIKPEFILPGKRIAPIDLSPARYAR